MKSQAILNTMKKSNMSGATDAIKLVIWRKNAKVKEAKGPEIAIVSQFYTSNLISYQNAFIFDILGYC